MGPNLLEKRIIDSAVSGIFYITTELLESRNDSEQYLIEIPKSI